jgi:uncharacterized protein with PQ loop repeat
VTRAIGWFSSLVLLLTITTQIVRQWREGTSKGVSPWLFVGQMIASTGFSVYSARVGDVVFVVTNVLMLCSAAVGLGIVGHHRRLARRRATDEPAPVSGERGRTTRRLLTPGRPALVRPSG